MLSSPQSVSTCLPPANVELASSPKRDEMAYQVVTISAILLLLASLWVF
jgi:hypothetical protein